LPEVLPRLLEREEQDKWQVHEFADRVRQEEDRNRKDPDQDEGSAILFHVSDKRFHKPDAT
jgi:hypothetical protein